jgi:hypothetical protein
MDSGVKHPHGVGQPTPTKALSRPEPLNSHTVCGLTGGGSTRTRKSQRRRQRLTRALARVRSTYLGQIQQADAAHVLGDLPAR